MYFSTTMRKTAPKFPIMSTLLLAHSNRGIVSWNGIRSNHYHGPAPKSARFPPKIRLLSVASEAMVDLCAGLVESDRELADLLKEEYNRQKDGIELIASENFTSKAVLECLGSCLTNKYSEGKVGERYYGGTDVIDKIETLCKKRALRAFGVDESEWGVNVQPYSGSPANLAIFTGLLKPHDRIMGLYLPDGGHLTHGFQTPKKKISATSIFWESIAYRLNKETNLIDYDEMEKLAVAVRPALIIAGFSCYSRHLDFARFRKIADSVGAYLMVDMAHVAGLIAAGLYPSPFPHAHIVTTTTHKTLRGPRSGVIFYSRKPGPNKEEFGSKIDSAVFPGLQGGPHNNVIAGVATAFKQVASQEFRNYATQVLANSRFMADCLMKNNCDVITKGTDNHIILLHTLNSFGVNGHHAEDYLNYVNVSVNKNACATDTSILRPSCIRIGTPAVTSRGIDQHGIVEICNILMATMNIAKSVLDTFERDQQKPIPAIEAMKLDKFADARAQLDQLKERGRLLMHRYPLAAGLADR